MSNTICFTFEKKSERDRIASMVYTNQFGFSGKGANPRLLSKAIDEFTDGKEFTQFKSGECKRCYTKLVHKELCPGHEVCFCPKCQGEYYGHKDSEEKK